MTLVLVALLFGVLGLVVGFVGGVYVQATKAAEIECKRRQLLGIRPGEAE